MCAHYSCPSWLSQERLARLVRVGWPDLSLFCGKLYSAPLKATVRPFWEEGTEWPTWISITCQFLGNVRIGNTDFETSEYYWLYWSTSLGFRTETTLITFAKRCTRKYDISLNLLLGHIMWLEALLCDYSSPASYVGLRTGCWGLNAVSHWVLEDSNLSPLFWDIYMNLLT